MVDFLAFMLLIFILYVLAIIYIVVKARISRIRELRKIADGEKNQLREIETRDITDIHVANTSQVSTLSWLTPNTEDFLATRIYYRNANEPEKAILLVTADWPRGSTQFHSHAHMGQATWYWLRAVYKDGTVSEKVDAGSYVP